MGWCPQGQTARFTPGLGCGRDVGSGSDRAFSRLIGSGLVAGVSKVTNRCRNLGAFPTVQTCNNPRPKEQDMKKILALMVVAALFAAACGADKTDVDASGDTGMTTITGELTYLQRIALIPGGTATIEVSDLSLQDVAAPVVGEITIDLDDQQIPIPFEIAVDTADLPPNGEFSLRAIIRDAEGQLNWTTDTIIPIDLAQPRMDVGQLTLVQVDPAGDEATGLAGEWNVIAIDGVTIIEGSVPTLNFGADGTLGGNASCNSFSTTYNADEDALTIDSEIAATLMACDPATSEQEAAFFAVLNEIAANDGATLTIAENALLITTTSGARISATR